MAASAAFLVGLTRALSDRVDDILPRFPFAYAEYNFYRAAQQGINATLLWPSGLANRSSPVEVSATHGVLTALPLAAEGLSLLGVASTESDRLLGIIRDRLRSGTTPSRWQRRVLDRLLPTHDPTDALALLVEQYLTQAQTGRPVHEWSDG
jgi:hypothetical protein